LSVVPGNGFPAGWPLTPLTPSVDIAYVSVA